MNQAKESKRGTIQYAIGKSILAKAAPLTDAVDFYFTVIENYACAMFWKHY